MHIHTHKHNRGGYKGGEGAKEATPTLGNKLQGPHVERENLDFKGGLSLSLNKRLRIKILNSHIYDDIIFIIFYSFFFAAYFSCASRVGTTNNSFNRKPVMS